MHHDGILPPRRIYSNVIPDCFAFDIVLGEMLKEIFIALRLEDEREKIITKSNFKWPNEKK